MKRVVLFPILLSCITMQAQKATLFGLEFPWTAAEPASIDSNPKDKANLAAFLAAAAEQSEKFKKAAPLFREVEKMFREIADTGENVGKIRLGFLYCAFSAETIETSKAISLVAHDIMLEHGLTTEEETRLWHSTLTPECSRSNTRFATRCTLAWVNYWG